MKMWIQQRWMYAGTHVEDGSTCSNMLQNISASGQSLTQYGDHRSAH
jgi:hypothetical protein